MSKFCHILVMVSYEHIKNNYLHLINLPLVKFILVLTLIFLLMSPSFGQIYMDAINYRFELYLAQRKRPMA